MNIVIIGLGNVGHSLLEFFGNEHRELILDINPGMFPAQNTQTNHKYVASDATHLQNIDSAIKTRNHPILGNTKLIGITTAAAKNMIITPFNHILW